MEKSQLALLKQFVSLCKANPEILQKPDLQFYREWLESLGANLPSSNSSARSKSHHSPSDVSGKAAKDSGEGKKETESDSEEEMEVDDPESELEIDKEGCVEPDTDNPLPQGEEMREVSEEDEDKANEMRAEASEAMANCEYEKAIQLFTEAILLNPHSVVLYAKRGQCFLKLSKPNAAIRDANAAIHLNSDSAPGYRVRGRAHRLLGDWEAAFRDLTLALKLDYDDDTYALLKEVEPRAKKIIEHKRKQERKQEGRADRERVRRAKRVQADRERAQREYEARKREQDHHEEQEASGSKAGGAFDFSSLLSDPELAAAMQDPEVQAAFADLKTNPLNFTKYQSNPKISTLMTKLMTKFGAGGAGTGFPAAGSTGAGFPGANASPRPPPSSASKKPTINDLD